MSILMIYALISLGFGVAGHIDCNVNPPKRVISKSECKIISYVSSPLWPLVAAKKMSDLSKHEQ